MGTFPTIKHYTKAVHEAACQQAGQTSEQYRLGTLKRCDVELAVLLEASGVELHPDHRDALSHLRNQVRAAIGSE